MVKKRLLITGASGVLGYALCRQALPAYDVYGVCYRGKISLAGVKPVRGDLTDEEQLAACFRDVDPHAVIHAAAYSQPNDCEQQPAQSEKVNFQAAIGIGRLCAEANIPFVFTSSDLVFDGEAAPYSEDDPVSPICVYGEHKAAAEKSLRKEYPEATICRMPLMLGSAPGTGSGFLGHMVRTMQAKQSLTLFTDEFRTPVDTDSAADGLLMALEKKGVLLHLGGRLRMSRYTMGCLAADVLKADPALLRPLRSADLPMAAPRSPDVSLESSRADALGYEPEDLLTALEKIIPRM